MFDDQDDDNLPRVECEMCGGDGSVYSGSESEETCGKVHVYRYTGKRTCHACGGSGSRE